MEIIKPRTLSGFMELLPEKQLKFDRMAEVLRKTYASYGFAPLDTPVIEDAQILLAKGGGRGKPARYSAGQHILPAAPSGRSAAQGRCRPW